MDAGKSSAPAVAPVVVEGPDVADIPIDSEAREIFLRIFDTVDLDKDGFITQNDIVYSMLSSSPNSTDPEYRAQQILNIFDSDKDGKIGRYEWILSLSRLPLPTADQIIEFSKQFNVHSTPFGVPPSEAEAAGGEEGGGEGSTEGNSDGNGGAKESSATTSQSNEGEGGVTGGGGAETV